EDETRLLTPAETQPFLAVGCGRHRQAALPQARVASPPQESIVFDQQDPLPRCLHRPHPLIGSVNMNAEPRPSSDSHQTSPASRSMMRRTRYRPSPVPSVSTVWTLSAR